MIRTTLHTAGWRRGRPWRCRPRRSRTRSRSVRSSSGLEGLADRVLGGDPHQPVLDDAIRHVLLAQGAPDLGDLLDLEAAVLGDDHRPGVGESPRAARRRSPVWPRWAWWPLLSFGTRPACGGGRPSRLGRAAPATSHGDRLSKVDPTRRGAAHPKVERRDLPRRARRRPRRPTVRPIRSDGSSPDRHRPIVGHGPRAQAVCGGSSVIVR